MKASLEKFLSEWRWAKSYVRNWAIVFFTLLAGSLYFSKILPDNVLFGLVAVFFVGFLVYYRYIDSRRLKQRTYESLSPEMRSEIDNERRTNIAKKQKFLEAMEKAGGTPPA